MVQEKTGGSYKSQSATYNIQQLKIHNYADTANLSFAELDYSRLQLSSFNKTGGFSVNTYTNITNNYYETQNTGSRSPYYLKFDGYSISVGSGPDNVTGAGWARIVNHANGTWVSATTQQITVNAPHQTTFIVTSTIPGTLNANTYYII